MRRLQRSAIVGTEPEMSSRRRGEFVLRGSKTPLKKKESGPLSNSSKTFTTTNLSQNGLKSSKRLHSSQEKAMPHEDLTDDLAGSYSAPSQNSNSPSPTRSPDSLSVQEQYLRYIDHLDESLSPTQITLSRNTVIKNLGQTSTRYTKTLDMPIYTGTLNGLTSERNNHRMSSDSDSLHGAPKDPEDVRWYTRPVHKDRKDVIMLSSRSTSPVTQQLGAEIAKRQSAIRERVLSEKETETLNQLIREYFPVTFGEAHKIHDPMDPSKVNPTSPPPKALVRPNSAPWNPKRTKNVHGRRPGSSRSAGDKTSVDKMLFLSAEAPTISSAGVLVSTPYQHDLARLRMERLHIEEEHLLEVKRQDELERIRGPQPHWYELKTPRFHYEAHKNNDLIKNKDNWQSLFDYRKQLVRASKDFQKTYYSADYDV